MTRRGFTFVELLVTIIIVGILANLAIPAMNEIKLRADAARVLSDYNSIRLAAYDIYASQGSFPASGSWNQVPAPFANALPFGFAFQYKTVDYRWQLYGTPSGNPLGPGRPLMGMEVRGANLSLMQAIRSGYRGQLAFGSPTQFTLVIE